MAGEKTKIDNMKTKLMMIQSELKAPKGQYNSFGKYNYRSAEDILESVKPHCVKWGVVLTLRDEIVLIGDRYYVKATATLADCEGDAQYVITAFAREAENKTGMDSSQITGTASSYARKYALNGLFCIDDTKDADTDEYRNTTTKAAAKASKPKAPAQPNRLTYRDKVMITGEEKGMSAKDLAAKFKLTRETTEERFKEVLAELEAM